MVLNSHQKAVNSSAHSLGSTLPTVKDGGLSFHTGALEFQEQGQHCCLPILSHISNKILNTQPHMSACGRREMGCSGAESGQKHHVGSNTGL